MRYCPECLEEYEDSVKECSDCEKGPLVTADELAKTPGFRRVREDDDTTSFVSIGTAEDLFDVDAFISAIEDAGIPVLAAVHRASTVDSLVTPMQRPWWEIRVPEAEKARASGILEERRRLLAEAEVDAEKAAEEEELETEPH